MNRPAHAQLHLPPLSPHDALVCVHILERLICAIWRCHGDAMQALLDDVHGHPPPDMQAPTAADDLPF